MYILTTHFLNGTVTIGVSTLGINSETFSDAIQKVKNLPAYKLATNILENDTILSFNLPKNNDIFISCYLKNEKLEII